MGETQAGWNGAFLQAWPGCPMVLVRACPKSAVRPSYGNKVGRADFVPITRIVVRNSLRHRMLSGHQGGNEREKPLRVFSLSSRSNLAFRTGSQRTAGWLSHHCPVKRSRAGHHAEHGRASGHRPKGSPTKDSRTEGPPMASPAPGQLACRGQTCFLPLDTRAMP